jgi:hypothetical protein
MITRITLIVALLVLSSLGHHNNFVFAYLNITSNPTLSTQTVSPPPRNTSLSFNPFTNSQVGDWIALEVTTTYAEPGTRPLRETKPIIYTITNADDTTVALTRTSPYLVPGWTFMRGGTFLRNKRPTVEEIFGKTVTDVKVSRGKDVIEVDKRNLSCTKIIFEATPRGVKVPWTYTTWWSPNIYTFGLVQARLEGFEFRGGEEIYITVELKVVGSGPAATKLPN